MLYMSPFDRTNIARSAAECISRRSLANNLRRSADLMVISKLITTAALAATLAAGSAQADGVQGGPLQVYDSHANLVGQLLGPGTLTINSGGKVYVVSFNREGFVSDGQLSYTSSNCTGQPYFVAPGSDPTFYLNALPTGT